MFGAKLVSVYGDPLRSGRTRHRRVIVAFDRATGDVACIADAEAVTTIRTASATAAATDALARHDARSQLVLGTDTQAEAHLSALSHIRDFERMVVWDWSAASADDLATRAGAALGRRLEVVRDVAAAARDADVICTVSSASEPILRGDWVTPGTHVNLVGSSHLGPVEIDSVLVTKARYIADYRRGALAQASELAVARTAGLVTDAHVVGEIGDVFGGRLAGRENEDQVTIYKSLGHVVQDLAAIDFIRTRASVQISDCVSSPPATYS